MDQSHTETSQQLLEQGSRILLQIIEEVSRAQTPKTTQDKSQNAPQLKPRPTKDVASTIQQIKLFHLEQIVQLPSYQQFSPFLCGFYTLHNMFLFLQLFFDQDKE